MKMSDFTTLHIVKRGDDFFVSKLKQYNESQIKLNVPTNVYNALIELTAGRIFCEFEFTKPVISISKVGDNKIDRDGKKIDISSKINKMEKFNVIVTEPNQFVRILVELYFNNPYKSTYTLNTYVKQHSLTCSVEKNDRGLYIDFGTGV